MVELFLLVLSLMFCTMMLVALFYVRDMFQSFLHYLEAQQTLISEAKAVLDRISLNYTDGYFDKDFGMLEVPAKNADAITQDEED